jgi:hypothetical protein
MVIARTELESRIKSININNPTVLTGLSVFVGVLAGYLVMHPTKLTIGIPAACFFALLIVFIAPKFSQDKEEKKIMLWLALSAFIVRAIVAFVMVSLSLYVIKDPVGGYSFANDAYRYLSSAHKIIEYLEQGNSVWFLFSGKYNWMSVTDISNSFPWVSFFITLFFGSYKTLIAGSLYSAFIASFAVLIVYKISKVLLPEDKKSFAVDAAIIAICYPSFVIFTSVMLKEATVIFVSYGLLYLFYRFIMTKRQEYLFVFIAGVAYLATLRVYGAGVVLFACVVSYFIYNFNIKNPKEVARAVIITAIVLILLLTVGRSLFKLDFIFSVLDVENMEYLRQKHYGNASSYFEIGDLSSPMGVMKAIPVGMTYMLLAPFPWQWLSGSDMIEKALAPDMIIYYIIFPFVVIGFFRLVFRRHLMGSLVISYFFALAVPYSILLGNFGTIYRLRTQLLPCIFIFAVVGGVPLVRWIYGLFKQIYTSVMKLPAKETILDH